MKPLQSVWSVLALFLCANVSIHATAEDIALGDKIQSLTRNTNHRIISTVDLDFDTHHTQGMTRAKGHFFLSAVDAIDRAKGIGKGYLFRFNENGEHDKTITLGEGAAYHPGGIDFDGKHIWVSVAEYRPDSTSIIYRVDPDTMDAEEVFRFNDHLGGIVSTGTQLVGVSWGSRNFYRWELDPEGNVRDPDAPLRKSNPSHFIDYQDGQWIPDTNLILFGGVASYALPERQRGSASVGGIALVDVTTLMPQFEIPIPVYSKRGRVMNQNPIYAEVNEKGIQIHFIPDDSRSTLYTVEFSLRTK